MRHRGAQGPLHARRLISYSRQSLPGTATVQATLIGPWQTAEFRLINVNEDFLQSLELALSDEASDGKTFLGSFAVPDEAFKFAVSGVDGQDAAYDVICSRVFQPRTIGSI